MIGRWIVVGGDQVRDQGQGVGGLLAWKQTEGSGLVIDSGEAAGSAFGDEKGEGGFNRSSPKRGRCRRRRRRGKSR